jgi:Tol biopolymer transport system component
MGRPSIVQLYRIDLDGTGLHQITSHTDAGLRDYGPKYSPDGNTIVFQGMTVKAFFPGWTLSRPS